MVVCVAWVAWVVLAYHRTTRDIPAGAVCGVLMHMSAMPLLAAFAALASQFLLCFVPMTAYVAGTPSVYALAPSADTPASHH